MERRRTANFVGAISAAIVTTFWFLVLSPLLGWNVNFPYEIVITKLVVPAAVFGCIYASFKGSRWWLIALVVSFIALITVVIAPV